MYHLHQVLVIFNVLADHSFLRGDGKEFCGVERPQSFDVYGEACFRCPMIRHRIKWLDLWQLRIVIRHSNIVYSVVFAPFNHLFEHHRYFICFELLCPTESQQIMVIPDIQRCYLLLHNMLFHLHKTLLLLRAHIISKPRINNRLLLLPKH